MSQLASHSLSRQFEGALTRRAADCNIHWGRSDFGVSCCRLGHVPAPDILKVILQTTFFAENGRQHRTHMTRLERLELSTRRPYAREKPGRPTFLPHGQLCDRFLGPFYSKRFRPIAKIEGLPVRYCWSVAISALPDGA